MNSTDWRALREAAQAYARLGYRAFRLKPGEKTPAFKGWQDEATCDPDRVAELWGETPYNIGIATGLELVVLDVDVKKGVDGRQTMDVLSYEQSPARVRTPSGGEHHYFSLPEGVTARNSVGEIGPGLDVRGDGGYVVAPPSVLKNGCYAFFEDCGLVPPDDLPPAPDWLLSLGGPARARMDTTPVVEWDHDHAVARGRAWLREEARPAIEGRGGDHHTLMTAMRLKDMGLSEAMVSDLMLSHWNDRCVPPWRPEELEAKVRNAFAYGAWPPGIDSPEYLFAGVNVDPPPPRTPSLWIDHGDDWRADVEWLFYQMLPTSGVVLLVGPSQAGKTFVLLELARSLATGKPFFGVAPDHRGGTVALYGGSEGSGFKQRAAALEEPGRLPISATAISGSLADAQTMRALAQSIADKAERFKHDFGIPLRLVVIETWASSGLVDNENDNAAAARAMAMLAELGRRLGVLVVLSHHPAKQGTESRGASSIIGAADCILTVEREGTQSVRDLFLTKCRHAEQRALGSFTLVPVDLGTDERGRWITSMRVSMADPRVRLSAPAKAVLRFAQWFNDAYEIDRHEIGGQRAVWTDVLRPIIADAMARASGAAPNKSNVRRHIRDAIASGRFEEIGHGDDACLVERHPFPSPLSDGHPQGGVTTSTTISA